MSDTPHVVMLMAVYNGAEGLRAQLDSLAAQTHENWSLLVSDDGSTDGSDALLQSFARAHPVTILEGPREGAAANFMSLIRQAGDHAPPGHWLAYCDQDDIWLPDRLARGIAALSQDGQEPRLYCTRTWITDWADTTRRLSAPRPRLPGFRNALVQNIASGNTTLLNHAAAQLVEAAAHEAGRVVVHDWWTYQIVTGAGGNVVHDDAPSLLYRQHPGNQIGANDTFGARLKRFAQLLRGDFRDWNDMNIAALNRSTTRLTDENRALLRDFAALRDMGLLARLRGLRALGLYRQSRASTAALWLSALIHRL